MKNILPYITIISAVLLIGCVLLQNQGMGLGSAFGGDSSFYRSKRGIERILFIATIILAIIFVGSIIGSLVIY
ncbi:preprotein translocase subunit SecG [Candidatus Saccharibacteria bacterium]|nr:preprotein translocase subunit SecG [Candidatus Saccharibacteria bacterium]